MLEEGLRTILGDLGLNLALNRVGSMMTLFFTEPEVTDFASAARSDTRRQTAFFLEMLQRGIYMAPSQFEALFVSQAHTEAQLEKTLAAARESLMR